MSYDYSYYEHEAAIETFLEESLRNISEDNARWYLGTYGDAIENRVNICLRQAEELHKLGFFSSAVTLCATAAELIIRFLLLRPLVQGALLSDEWAEILANRIANGRSAEDRALLPAVLKCWSIDITAIKLSNRASLWESIINILWPKRNKILHLGEAAIDSDAIIGIECVKVLLIEVVYQVAIKLGFTLETTCKWCQIHKLGKNFLSQTFYPKNPFQ